jgi:hypothetical protein
MTDTARYLLTVAGTAGLGLVALWLALNLWRATRKLPLPEDWSSRYGRLSRERTALLRKTGR